MMATIAPVVLLATSGVFAVVVQTKRNAAKKMEAEIAT